MKLNYEQEMLRSQLDILDKPDINPFQFDELRHLMSRRHLPMSTAQQKDSDFEDDSEIGIFGNFKA